MGRFRGPGTWEPSHRDQGALSCNTTGVYSGLTTRLLGSSPDPPSPATPTLRRGCTTGPWGPSRRAVGGAVPPSPPQLTAVLPSFRPPWRPQGDSLAPRSRRQWSRLRWTQCLCWGVRGKAHGTRMFFVVVFFFVPKPTARVLYF